MLLPIGTALSQQIDDGHARPATPGDQIDYPHRVAEAMRGVVRDVLTETARRGRLPGEHYFLIVFDTRAEGVRLSNALRETYPVKMTVILQYEFADLTASETAIEVDLWFSGRKERLRIPFGAMTAFYDPSANFSVGLRVEDPKDPAPAP